VYPLVALGSFALAAVLTPVALRAALSIGALDHPAPGKRHVEAVPYLGGLAIVAAFAVAVVAGALAWHPRAGLSALGTMLGTALGLSVLGLVDDLAGPRGLPVALRLGAEAAAAAAVWATGTRLALARVPAWLDAILAVGFLVGVANAYNLLDNIDGLSAGVAAIGAAGLCGIALLDGEYLVGVLAAALAGCAAGFLPLNFHPARIHMGDAGSLFLGFMLGSLALRMRTHALHRVDLAALLAVVAPALFDTGLVVVTRIARGQNPFVGGQDHTSHRLVALGMAVETAVGTIYAIAALMAALGVAFAWAAPEVRIVGLAAVLTSMIGAGAWLVARTEGRIVQQQEPVGAADAGGRLAGCSDATDAPRLAVASTGSSAAGPPPPPTARRGPADSGAYTPPGESTAAIPTRGPLLSVIVPVGGPKASASKLAAALESVLSQHRPAASRAALADWLEVLVVDDGTDGLVDEAVRVLAAQAPPGSLEVMQVVRQPNRRGAPAARNAGVAAAQAPVVAFLDADDRWLQGTAAALIQALNAAKPPVVGATGAFWLERPNGRVELRRVAAWPTLTNLAIRGCPLAPGSTLALKRAAWLELGGEDEALERLEDWDLLLRMARVGMELAIVDRPLAWIARGPHPTPTIVERSCLRILERHHPWVRALGSSASRALVAGVHYELGVAHVRHGDTPRGAWELLRAMMLDPRGRLRMRLRRTSPISSRPRRLGTGWSEPAL
jgi:UDP-GlcNAc:undecaprenyl-phosphate GlcNAc-1-phosphate transferase